MSIKPIGGVRTITGTFASELIGLNGADNVTFDGNIAGVNSLIISNTSTATTSGTSTIRFYLDATNNVVNNCNVLGSATMAVNVNGGNIWFHTALTTTGTGNDNNTISNCNIGPAGVNSPSKGVYFSGTAVRENNGNSINNNNIYDVFNGGVASAGIYLTTGSAANSFTNNKFYQTTAKTFTAGVTHSGIFITNTTTAEGFTITGNTIGYATNTGTGTYALSGNFATKFYGIYVNGKNSGISSTISNNTVANISLTGGTSVGVGTASPFTAIQVEKGVAVTNDNIIGSQTAINSLVFSTTTTTSTEVYGILNNATNDSWTANNNSIGGISISNAAATGDFKFAAIKSSTGIAGTLTANNNTIGGTIADSISFSSASTGVVQTFGLWSISTILTATNNTIRNMTTNSRNTGLDGASALLGIATSSSGIVKQINNNKIYNLTASNAGAFSVSVTGILSGGSTTPTAEINGNTIYNLKNFSTGAAPYIYGHNNVTGGTLTCANNMISIGNGSLTNPMQCYGISDSGNSGLRNYYFNSLNIYGTATSGILKSIAFQFNKVGASFTPVTYIKNNIFNVTRTGFGKNYAAGNLTGTNSNGIFYENNIYNVVDQTTVGVTNGPVDSDFASWQLYEGDINSFTQVPISFADVTIADLHITSICSGAIADGLDGLPITTDYDNQTRSTVPDIGADEYSGTKYIWNGSTWAPPSPLPTTSNIVVLNGNYNMTTLQSIDACSLIIKSGTTTIAANKYLNIQNDLTINNGAILNIENNGSVVMINDSGVVTNSGTGIANVTRNTTPYERYDYTYWSAPVLNPTIGSSLSAWRQNYSFEFNATNFLDLYSGQGFPQVVGSSDTFDDNDDDRIPVLQTTPMLPAKGYAILENSVGPFPITTPVTFSGKLNNGSITIPIQLSPGIIDPNDDLNLVGNPYPSAISANNFINANFANISGTLYFWTHKADVSISNPGPDVYNFTNDDYAYYNLSGGIATAATTGTGSITGSAAPTGFIASGQGFFVDAQVATNLVFNNAMRSKTYNNSNFWRPNTLNQNDKIWINLTNNDGLFSQQLIGYFDNATLNKDQAFDAEVLKGPSNINFYSISQTENFKIQARPTFNDNDMVPIGFSTTSNGNFTIAIDHQEGVFNNQNIYLQDNLLNIVHDLKQAPYSFYTSFGTFNDRFNLKYNNLTLSNNIFDEDLNEIKISIKDSQINILSTNQNFQSIQIFDVLGRNIYEKQFISTKFFQINNLSIKNQTIIIKTKLENGKIITRKVIF